MTALVSSRSVQTKGAPRSREILRILRLHAVNPSIFFGVPLLILSAAWAVSSIIALIMSGAGASAEDLQGMRYSWAVLSPQWYLMVVGVQAVGLTFSFALGFGATRRDFWLGTSLMFVATSALFAALIASLVQLEIATGGWGIGVHMFNALWFGTNGWLMDFYSAFALQLLVLFLGASITTVYMRWRMRGMIVVLFLAAAVLPGLLAIVTLGGHWPDVINWFGAIGMAGTFTVLLALAGVCAAAGYLVIRRATPR
ncbi:hypothetical protein V1638_04865 [Pseudarthrobacter sp. J64]|uniref:hypothetical protein n=1 Tax=Pseudarthrobacter sp. J64 TaxID=3116485 RepID=UPI002E817FA0|nr:hypothetical protein [Pseudarthrobacter sp. J64]MEE2568724.1 hypothetical protein [Pseudarthrobacter sp. J64]